MRRSETRRIQPGLLHRWLLTLVLLALGACSALRPAPSPTLTPGPTLTSSPTPALSPTLAASPTPTPLLRPYPLPRVDGPEHGIQAFLWWHVDNKTGQRDADLVRDLGFQWLKQSFAWDSISGSRGGYDWFRPDGVLALAEERGLKVLARLDHPPFWARPEDPAAGPADPVLFAEFCSAVATRYRGRIAAYEIWNEPNLAREWGDQPPNPARYVELLKACYLAIKEADPRAIVISAGLAPTGTDDTAVAMPDMKFYEEFYAAGGAAYADMLGVHAPGYMNPPERSPDETEADPDLAVRWITFRHVEDVRDLMVQAGDGDKQIAITEMGWTSDTVNPTYSWYAVDEETRADYLVRAFQYARANWQPWIALMSIVYIADPEWTEAHEQYWWAITRPTAPGDPPVLLPAYEALREMER